MTSTSRVLCDMRSASDTPEQRGADYRELFDTALCGRDRTERMVRFRFRRAAVDEQLLRSLAAREQACCPFFDIRIISSGHELWWEIRVDDVDEAKIMLDELSRLPERLAQHIDVVNRLIERGSLLPTRSDPTTVTASRTLRRGDRRQWRRSLRALVVATLAAVAMLLAASTPAQASIEPGYYQVVNRQTGECLDVWGASTEHAANVGVWRCVGADNQQWRLAYVGNGFYQVRVLHTDMCLDVAYRGTANNADVVQATCADPSLRTSYNQHWRLAYLNGYYQLVARHSGRCLDKAWSGDVVQWACGGEDTWWQQWSLR